MGTIVTFYSFKGGTGRSMALANIGSVLARWGWRTLVIDWDFEAPGLEQFFSSYSNKNLAERDGMVDFLDRVSDANDLITVENAATWRELETDITHPNTKGNGKLSLIVAGRRRVEHDDQYYKKVRTFDVEEFYGPERNGGKIIDSLIEQWHSNEYFDFILLDSRTGITDMGGVCTIHLPDILILLFTPTAQALQGTLGAAERALAKRARLPGDRPALRIVPVASRFDFRQETELSNSWLRQGASILGKLCNNWLSRDVEPIAYMKETAIRYKPHASFGEPLMHEESDNPASISYYYRNIAALLAHDLGKVDVLVSRRDQFIEEAKAYIEAGKSMSFRMPSDEGWHPWMRKEPINVIFPPIVARSKDKRLVVFVRSADGALLYSSETEPGKDEWNDWVSLGGDVYDPQVVANEDGCLEVFALGPRGDLWHIWQKEADASVWSEWTLLNHVVHGAPAVAQNRDGRLQVFIQGTDGALWHKSQVESGTSQWTNWSSLYGAVNSVRVIDNDDGRLEVFAKGENAGLWHIWQRRANRDYWSRWASLGGVLESVPAVGRNSDGRLEVFTRGSDGGLWHIHQEEKGSDYWSAWASLSSYGVHVPQVISNAEGQIEVFVRGNERALWRIRQEKGNSDHWSEWENLGGVLPDTPAVILNAHSRVQVFVRGSDGNLWRRFA